MSVELRELPLSRGAVFYRTGIRHYEVDLHATLARNQVGFQNDKHNMGAVQRRTEAPGAAEARSAFSCLKAFVAADCSVLSMQL
jgi:hypothetical protein